MRAITSTKSVPIFTPLTRLPATVRCPARVGYIPPAYRVALIHMPEVRAKSWTIPEGDRLQILDILPVFYCVFNFRSCAVTDITPNIQNNDLIREIDFPLMNFVDNLFHPFLISDMGFIIRFVIIVR